MYFKKNINCISKYLSYKSLCCLKLNTRCRSFLLVAGPCRLKSWHWHLSSTLYALSKKIQHNFDNKNEVWIVNRLVVLTVLDHYYYPNRWQYTARSNVWYLWYAWFIIGLDTLLNNRHSLFKNNLLPWGTSTNSFVTGHKWLPSDLFETCWFITRNQVGSWQKKT